MSEEQEQQEQTAAGALDRVLNDEQKEKLRAAVEKLKKHASQEKTLSGSEAPKDGPEQGPIRDGSKIDWSEYELPYELRHLYPQSQLRPTPQGEKWVVELAEFFSDTKDFGNHGKRRNQGDGEAMNLGEYLNDVVNSPEQWRPAMMLPAIGGRVGILLQRSKLITLPDPVPLKKETEVEPPKDGELRQVEEAALKFAENEGLSAPSVGSLEQLALDLNGPADSTPALLDATPSEGAPDGEGETD